MTAVGVVEGPHRGLRGTGYFSEFSTSSTDELWEVVPFHDLNGAVKVCREHLRVIPPTWLREVQSPSYNFLGITHIFQGPCLLHQVIALDRFFCAAPPCTHDVHSWWGNEVYRAMRSILQEMVANKTRRPGELRHFCCSTRQWRAGVAYCDGDKATQQSERASTGHCRERWWPVIFVEDQFSRDYVIAFCQAQALDGSRPWRTHKSRVVLCRQATQQLLTETSNAYVLPCPPFASLTPAHDPVNYSTVVIEEMSDADTTQDDEWTVLGEQQLL